MDPDTVRVRDGGSDTGRIIARFDAYAHTQRAADALANRKFAVEHLAIVGTGLGSVEQVTAGRLPKGSSLVRTVGVQPS